MTRADLLGLAVTAAIVGYLVWAALHALAQAGGA